MSQSICCKGLTYVSLYKLNGCNWTLALKYEEIFFKINLPDCGSNGKFVVFFCFSEIKLFFNWHLRSLLHYFISYEHLYNDTVKPVHNGHPWELIKEAFWRRGLIKVRFRLVVDDSNWPLLTGGRCLEVAVKAGLTVYWIFYLFHLSQWFNWCTIYYSYMPSLKTYQIWIFTNRNILNIQLVTYK